MQIPLVQGPSRAGVWYLPTHKGNTSMVEAVGLHIATTVSALRGRRFRLRAKQEEEELLLHETRLWQKAGYCSGLKPLQEPFLQLLTFIPTAPVSVSTKRLWVPHWRALVLSISRPVSLSPILGLQQSHPIPRDPFLHRHLFSLTLHPGQPFPNRLNTPPCCPQCQGQKFTRKEQEIQL